MILCCGEALIDMIPVVQPDGSTAFAPHVGGAIFNTAIALGRLGVPVGMTSGVSRDVFGAQLVQALEGNQVSTDYLVRSDLPTTLAIVHLLDGQATYSFYDEGCAGRMLNADDMPAIPGETSALYFGGISLVSAPAADAYAAFCARGAGENPVMLDPNIRPSFITDQAGYRARLDDMFGLSDIAKVSDEDLAWIAQGRGTLEGQVADLAAKGPRIIIVTRGAEGAMVFCNGEMASTPAIAAKVVDTVGAGDTFNAGVLAGLHQAGVLSKAGIASLSARDMVAALEMGARVAAVTVSRKGANPPWAHEL